jgi:hypothetical protein
MLGTVPRHLSAGTEEGDEESQCLSQDSNGTLTEPYFCVNSLGGNDGLRIKFVLTEIMSLKNFLRLKVKMKYATRRSCELRESAVSQ